MGIYKYFLKNNKTKYLVKAYYKDSLGNTKPICKRGFLTKAEAKKYEANFKAQNRGNCDIPFSKICEEYLKDCKTNGLREGTIKNKEYIINSLFIPYFKDIPINKITQIDIKRWKEYIIENNPYYSPSYLYNINHLLFYVFDFAVNIYDLYHNVARKAKSMGKAKYKKSNFWTEEDFKKFLNVLMDDDLQRSCHVNRSADIKSMYIAFNVLFYTGLRISELFGLTVSDLVDNTININKQYKYHKLVRYVKEAASERVLPISADLATLIKEQIAKIYAPTPDTRIFFNLNPDNLRKALSSTADIAALKRLTPHDLRDSCCSFLISKGVKPLALKNYMGHAKIQTTLDYYGHVYADELDEIAKLYSIK